MTRRRWWAPRDAALAGPSFAAPPQTVYRCGPAGRSYSQTPCADGHAVVVDDVRSASQQKAAREVAARDAEHAKQLAAERRQREEAARGQQAAGFRTAPTAAEAAPAPAPARKSKSKSAATTRAPKPIAATSR